MRSANRSEGIGEPIPNTPAGAEELGGLNQEYNFDLMGPLLFKTDLHNTWEFTLSRPGDGYHELLEQQNQLPKFFF